MFSTKCFSALAMKRKDGDPSSLDERSPKFPWHGAVFFGTLKVPPTNPEMFWRAGADPAQR